MIKSLASQGQLNNTDNDTSGYHQFLSGHCKHGEGSEWQKMVTLRTGPEYFNICTVTSSREFQTKWNSNKRALNSKC